MKKFLYLLVLSQVMGGCSQINERLDLEDDNDVEEFVEFVIEYKTGLDVDLMPSTPEN